MRWCYCIVPPEVKILRISLRHITGLDIIWHVLLERVGVHIERARVPRPGLVGLEDDGLVHDETDVHACCGGGVASQAFDCEVPELRDHVTRKLRVWEGDGIEGRSFVGLKRPMTGVTLLS